MHKYDTFVYLCKISSNVGNTFFFCPCVLRNDCIVLWPCVCFMLCVTGKWLSADAKVCSIKCFDCAVNDPSYLDVDGKFKI